MEDLEKAVESAIVLSGDGLGDTLEHQQRRLMVSLSSLIHYLVGMAKDPSAGANQAYRILERAESWISKVELSPLLKDLLLTMTEKSFFDKDMRPESMATGLEFLELKATVYSAIRDTIGALNRWQKAHDYASSVIKIEETIATAVMSSASFLEDPIDAWRDSSASASVTFLRSKVAQYSTSAENGGGGVLRFAKLWINMCVFSGKLLRHNEAAREAANAILLLNTFVERAGVEHRHDVGFDVFYFLVVAYFNHAVQMELAGREAESDTSYMEAYRVAQDNCDPSGEAHSLLPKLKAILVEKCLLVDHRERRKETKRPSTMETGRRTRSQQPPSAVRGVESAKKRQDTPPMPEARVKKGERLFVMAAPTVKKVQKVQRLPPPSDLPPSTAATPKPPQSAPSGPRPRRGSAPSAAAEEGPRPTESLITVPGEMMAHLTGGGGSTGGPATLAARPSSHDSLGRNTKQQPTADEPNVTVTSIDLTGTHRGRVSRSSVGSGAVAERVTPALEPLNLSKGKTPALDDSTPFERKCAENQAKFQEWLAQCTGKLYAEYSTRDAAALKIQLAWRSAKARLEAHNRRQLFYYFLYREQKAAAECIVSRCRTLLSSKKRKAMHESEKLANQQRAERERKRSQAVKLIAKNMRIYAAKRKRERQLMRELRLEQEDKLKQYESASVVIQRWWPIVKDERKYWKRRSAEIEEENRQREEQIRKDNAATNISRLWRGVLARKYASMYKAKKISQHRELQRQLAAATDVVRIVLREYRARCRRLGREAALEESRRHEAASRISQGWKDCLCRRATHQLNNQVRVANAACAKIQRLFKAFKARRSLRVAKVISRTHKLSRIEMEYKRHRAAIRIQSFVRQVLAKRLRRRILAGKGRMMIKASELIQRVGRGQVARKAVAFDLYVKERLVMEALEAAMMQRNAFVSLIQAFSRAHLSVSYAVGIVDAIEAEELLIIRRTKREMRRERAATKITKTAKMFLAKRYVAAMKKNLASSQENLLKNVIIPIQCWMRRMLAKKILTKKKIQRKKKQDSKRFQEEMQTELFMSREMEMEHLMHLLRRRIEEAEASEFLYLTHWEGGGGNGDDDENKPNDNSSEDDDEEEGIYD